MAENLWHENKNGQLVRCPAKIKCRLGGEHFPGKTAKEAEKAREKYLTESHATIESLTSIVTSTPRGEPYEAVAFGEGPPDDPNDSAEAAPLCPQCKQFPCVCKELLAKAEDIANDWGIPEGKILSLESYFDGESKKVYSVFKDFDEYAPDFGYGFHENPDGTVNTIYLTGSEIVGDGKEENMEKAYETLVEQLSDEYYDPIKSGDVPLTGRAYSDAEGDFSAGPGFWRSFTVVDDAGIEGLKNTRLYKDLEDRLQETIEEKLVEDAENDDPDPDYYYDSRFDD